MDTLPKTVTRFYGNLNHALSVIRDKQIAFVHLSQLNDPFDPYFFFETDFGEDYSKLITHIKEHHARDVGWFRNQMPPTNWQQVVQELKNKLKVWRERSFIFSTSAPYNDEHPKDNLYMWGHYGKGHRGVAIEFDTSELAKAAIEQNKRAKGAEVGVDNVWCHIQYQRKLPLLTCEHFYEFYKDEKDFTSGKRLKEVLSNWANIMN